MSAKKLKKRFLYENYFKKEDFLVKKLVSNAIPLPYCGCENIQKTYSIQSFDEPSPSGSNINGEILYLTPTKSTYESPEYKQLDITNMPSPSTSKRKLDCNESPIALKMRLINT